MKRKIPLRLRQTTPALAMASIPTAALAQSALASIPAVEMSLTAYLIIAFLLVLSIMMFFLFQHRFHKAATELKGVTAELGGTRQRLVEANRQLEVSQKEHQATERRYQNILFDAKTGMFQMDLAGKCTYLNTAMQEMSGLYPKKALKEGLASAIHPDDRAAFHAAWRAFADGNAEFDQVFRFLHAKGREVHVACRVNKVYDAKKEVESYIGWAADVTEFHAAQLQERAATERYEHFVGETIEGFYKLAPPTPIALKGDPREICESIMERFVLVDCNDTFAALYGKNARDLLGKSINELKDGVGAFKNNESIQEFIRCGYKAIDLESVRQDPSGNRLNLMNNVIGIIEDDRLAGIWGSQRNNSRDKREKTELSNKVQFMQRILNALPADVHVKDTRCRYLYASQKLADRTGIPQEEWIGKTIFEVMPATPRDHDQTAIEVMKSTALCRIERPYEARGKSGWMETVQIPLVSDEGLVEGVVGISLEISDRKKKEEEARRVRGELERHLQQTRDELAQSRTEYGKTATSLSDAIQKLKMAEAEKTNREHEFKLQLSERKRAEDILRRNEEGLLSRQQQLEEQLAKRLAQLDAETDKRKKWEELLSIREDELRKAEELATELNEHHEHETHLREQAEAGLEASQTALAKVRRELEELAAQRQDEIRALNEDHATRFDAEHRACAKALKELTTTREALENTQEQVKRMTEQHAAELEKEVAERKTAAEKLIQSMEELDELRQQFSLRIEEQTKALKRELAQKQIREKALRRHEKDLENRIMELEQTLQEKTQAYTEQIQAREGAEADKLQLEHKLEQLTLRQQQLVNRETEKLNLNIAEIRLDEVKLRKRASDLEQAKDDLEEALRQRDAELEKAQQEIKRTEALLADTQAGLKQLTNDRSQGIAKETEELQRKINALEKRDTELRGQLGALMEEKGAIENKLESRNGDLTKAAREYRKIVDAYKATQAKLKQLADSQDTFVAKKTETLKGELEQLRISEKTLTAKEQQLQRQIETQQQKLHKLAGDLQAETEGRKDAEMALKNLQARYADSRQDADSRILVETQNLSKQIEEYRQNENTLMQQLEAADKAVQQRDRSLAELKQEREQTAEQLKQAEQKLADIEHAHRAELNQSLAEVQEIGRRNSTLVDEVNETVRTCLSPVLKTTVIMEQADNLSTEQKRELVSANHQCRSLIDMMDYRKGLTHLADGSDAVARSQCDLHALLADIDHQFCHRAKTNKLFFAVGFAQYQTANNVPKHVATDPEKLRKTLSILLGYALDHTKKGRVGLHASRKSADSSGMVIAFEMTFTATETRNDLLADIFDSETEGVVDLKHGLTLARRYIAMLGGKAKLEHREAGVTALTIDFPFARAGAETATPAQEKGEQAAGAA